MCIVHNAHTQVFLQSEQDKGHHVEQARTLLYIAVDRCTLHGIRKTVVQAWDPATFTSTQESQLTIIKAGIPS